MISRERLVQLAPLLVLIALILFFTAINPNFFSLRNAARIGISAAPILIIALGVTFIIVMGSIDLSMEGAVATTAVIFSYFMIAWGGELAGLGFLPCHWDWPSV